MKKDFPRKPYAGKPREDKVKVEIKQAGSSANTTGCFICNGPHWARECPKREKLATLVTEGDSDSDPPSRINPLQLLGTLRTVKGNSPLPLLYVHAVVNGREIDAMVDTGATHNFVSELAIARLGLSVVKHTSRVKAINSKAQPVVGVVQAATISLGDWSGRIDLLGVPLDDFDLILGIDFLTTAKAAVMPHLGGMLIMEESHPHFVAGIRKEKKGKEVLLSAMQVEHGLAEERRTHLPGGHAGAEA